MKALILNSGLGKRLGKLTEKTNKCLVLIQDGITIIDRQLKMLEKQGIKEIVITTGPFANELQNHIIHKFPQLKFEFVYNDKYESTNYIYSIYLARDLLTDDDILLLHGDLVFEEEILAQVIKSKVSTMVVDTTLPLPDKDFKAVVKDNKIVKVGVEFFENSFSAQALYKLYKKDWNIWLKEIVFFCEHGRNNVYAEKALNKVLEELVIVPTDAKGCLCAEIDDINDLKSVREKLGELRGEIYV